MYRTVLAALLATGLTLDAGLETRPAAAERDPFDTHELWRDLLAESSRAELDRHGLFIDLGTADQDKYTRGGWKTGWGDRRRGDDGVSYADLIKREAQLATLLHEKPRELVVRARAKSDTVDLRVEFGGQKLSVSMGSATRVRLDDQWRVFRFRIPSDASAGRKSIVLRSPARTQRRAQIDWIWLRTGESPVPSAMDTRVGSLRLDGRPRRALLAPGSSRYSYYLHVPTRGILSFAYGADKNTRFIVRVQDEKGKTRQLFDQRATPGQWREAHVDLRAYGKRAVRLELATESEGASEGASAGWGQPSILAPRRSDRYRRRRGKKPRNVLLVVYDTTRADVFSKFADIDHDGPVIAPNFEKLSRRSTTFVRAYNNESWTRPSTISILTGLYPSTHGALYAKSVLDSGVELLSEHLQDNGFRTFGIVGNSVLGPTFGLDQGWDEYREYGHEDNSAGRIFGEAIEWIETNHDKQPFFVYIQSHDSHTPYEVEREYTKPFYPDDYRGRVGTSFSDDEQKDVDKRRMRLDRRDEAWVQALYNGEARYQDEYFGRLIERMDSLGILDDTLIVVTNDHGEEFGEHGEWGHAWTLYDQLLRAPLLMYAPGLMPADREIVETVEHVDVAPTIADALGLPPMRDADGLSLMSLVDGRGMRPRPFYAIAQLRRSKQAIHVGQWKLIVDRESGWEELYNVDEDPAEKRSRLRDRVIPGRLCEIYLGEALAAPKKSQRMQNMTTRQRYRSRSATLDAKTQRSLEALGYLGQEDAILEETDDD